MMPKMDGIQTITEIRKTSNVPVIFLTAKSEDTDMILGLNIGADDYITKPFNPVEVLARVKSNLRRYLTLGSQSKKDVYSMGGIELNPKAKEVTLDGDALSLTPTEFKILELLMEHPGEVISPKEIYTSVWQDDSFGTENIVAVHVRHLREKIEIDPANPRHLKVVWGQGYKMEA
jgi:DNA-binding response OmpR family regulator